MYIYADVLGAFSFTNLKMTVETDGDASFSSIPSIAATLSSAFMI